MLKTLKIENFRRFRELTFPTLKRVNLIAGKNNAGKTGVLESLVVLLGGTVAIGNLHDVFRNSGPAGNSRDDFWNWQFHNSETGSPIFVRANTDEYGEIAVAISQ